MSFPALSLRLAFVVVAFVGELGAAPPPPYLAAPLPHADPWQQRMDDSVKALKNNQLGQAIALCAQAEALARTFGPGDTHLSRSQVLRAEIYMWEKKNDLAEHAFLEAVASCERAVGPNHPDVVHPLASLANFYYYVVVRYDRVAPLFERILAIAEHAPQRDDRQVIMWSRNLGLIDQQLGRFAEAEPHFARALTLAEAAAPDWTPHELLNSAAFYRAWRKYPRADALAQRALAMREGALAKVPDNVDAKLDVAVALDELGAIQLAEGQAGDAEKSARRSLALVESFMTAEQPDLTPRLLGLATVLRSRGNLEESAALYRRALDVTEKNLGGTSKETAGLLSAYASLLREMKKDNDAKAIEARVESIRQHATPATS